MSLFHEGFLMINKAWAHTDVLPSLFTITSFFLYWLVYLSWQVRDLVTLKTSVQVDCHQQICLHVVVVEKQKERHMHKDCAFMQSSKTTWCNLEKDHVVFAVNAEQFQSRHFLGNVRVRGLKIRVRPDTWLINSFAVTLHHGCSAYLSKLLFECPYSLYSPFISALLLTV